MADPQNKDPYAAYGGQAEADPYAAYGGSRTDAPEPPAPSPQSREAGPMERFAVRALHLHDDIFQNPGAYLNPFSKAYWEKGKQEQAAEKASPPPTATLIPAFASQANEDFQSGNVAGALGDVVGPAAKIMQVAGPLIGEGMQSPTMSTAITKGGKYVGGAVGGKVAGWPGAIAGAGLGEVLAKPTASLTNKLGGVMAKTGAGSLREIYEQATPQAKAELETKLQSHQAAVQDLHQQLGDALAKFHDIADYRVQPGEKAPQNLLDAAKNVPQSGFDEATQTYIRPSKMGTPQGIQDMLAAAKSGESTTARVDTHKVAKTSIGKEVSATPNATIYDEPIQEKTAKQIYAEKFLQKSAPKQTLLEQLRQWDQIRQIHSQLEDQIGKGQDEIQQWMEDHNQETAGGKSTAKPAEKSSAPKVDKPQVPKSDAEIETLLMKSLKKYGFKRDPKTGNMVKVSAAGAD